jgi:hypothetical protein
MLTDLFVHLNVEQGRQAVPLGITIAVQVKSTEKPFDLTADQLQVATKSAIPWFLAVCDKTGSTLNVYSTLDRLFHRGSGKGTRVSFDHRSEDGETLNAPSGLHVGPPVASVRLADLEQRGLRERREACDHFRKILWSFAWWEIVAIAELSTSLPWVLRPKRVVTNQVFDGKLTSVPVAAGLVNVSNIARGETVRLMAVHDEIKKGKATALDRKAAADLRNAAEAILGLLGSGREE